MKTLIKNNRFFPFAGARLCVLAWVFVCLVALLPSSVKAGEFADILFVNGVVYTVDAHNSRAEALAVKDGRIVFVGSTAEGRALQGPHTKLVDLADKLLLPGFIDAHIHTPGPFSPGLFDINLMGIYDEAATLAAIAREIKENPDKTQYIAFGYAGSAFTGEEALKGPKKERLDALCADKPVFIFSNDGHTVWVNSQALAVSGIHADTLAPQGGVIEKDATGAVWGVVKDTAVSLLRMESFSHARMLDSLEKYQRLMNSFGYTAIMSATASLVPGIDRVPWELLHELEKSDRLTLRVHGAAGLAPYDKLEEKLAEFKELRQRYASNFLRMNTVKSFADGVVDTRTAYLLDPYANDPGTRGEPVWAAEAMRHAFAAVNREGFQLHTHAIGDAAVRMTLDAYAYAARSLPLQEKKYDLRNTITHIQLVDPSDIPRFSAESVIAGVQPYWHFKQPGYWKDVEYAALGERAEREYPMKSLLDAGAVLASSSDSPVTMLPDPLRAIQLGVTRNLISTAEYPDYVDSAGKGLAEISDSNDPTWLLSPAERLPVSEMIRSFTASAAYAMHAEQSFGSLERGKWADLVVLDTNILDCPVEKIHTAHVVQTYTAGRLVYARAK